MVNTVVGRFIDSSTNFTDLTGITVSTVKIVGFLFCIKAYFIALK